MFLNLCIASHLGSSWCGICDAFQTSAIEEFGSIKLQNLAELFGLSPDLLSF